MEKLFFKRVFATGVDIVMLLIFSFSFWSIANNSCGMLFDKVFFSEDSAYKNLSYFISFFLPVSFVYYLSAGISKGFTFGKVLLNLKIKSVNGNIKITHFLVRELFWKWFMFIAIPSLIFLIYKFMGTGIFIIFLLAYLIISIILWILRRETLIDILTGTTAVNLVNGERIVSNHVFLSLSALVIDLSLIITFSLFFDYLIQGIWYIQFFHILFTTLFLYCLIAGLLKGNTIGKYYLGIHILRDHGKTGKRKIFKREVIYKYGLSILIPYLLLILLGIVDAYHIFLNILVLVGFLLILFYSFKGQSWWGYLSQTSKIVYPLSKNKMIVVIMFLLLIFGSSFAYIKHQNNIRQDDKIKVLGFNYPFNFPEYPNSKKVDRYYTYMLEQNQSPKDYIIGLFDKYDIVILGENFHGESTQWEMIYDVVSDKRFIENVGNVFTEYGSIAHQDRIDKYLITKFENDTLLEKATASLMYYMSGGFYYFLKNINKLNNQLPDSLKIHEYFTDILDWDYSVAFDRFNVPDLDKRDSLLAQVTINWFRETNRTERKKKCLVITNYRHAFGYAGGVKQVKDKPKFLHLTSGNQGQYIFEAFPLQTACVLQSSPNNSSKAFYLPFKAPINHGIWDKAFALLNFRPVGFDLAGSPFGMDKFDMYNMHGAKQNLRYQDIFTGVVFDKKFTELKEVNHPFLRYAFEQDYKAKNININSNNIQGWLNQLSDEAGISTTMRWAIQICISNFLGVFFFLVMSSISLLIAIYHLFKRLIIR